MTLLNCFSQMLGLLEISTGTLGALFGCLSYVYTKPAVFLRVLAVILLVGALSWTGYNYFSCHDSGCSIAGRYLRFQDGAINNPYNYVLVSDSVSLPENSDSLRIARFRKQLLTSTFRQADRAMGTHFTQTILPYFGRKDAVSEAIIAEASNRSLLVVDEGIDTLTCIYQLQLSVSKKGARYIDSLVALAKDNVCISGAIDQLVINQVQRNGRLSLSLEELIDGICNACSASAIARMWQQYEVNNWSRDSVFFSRGVYKLSTTSTVILDRLRSRLETAGKFRIEFHGYTDSVRVNNIVYDEDGWYAEQPGIPLPSPGNAAAKRITSPITENLTLSYARAYSCYRLLRQTRTGDALTAFYTGHGVHPATGPDASKRSVYIIITQEK